MGELTNEQIEILDRFNFDELMSYLISVYGRNQMKEWETIDMILEDLE